ncbi:prepilin peptidase [Neisseria weaveri]|uniref:Prepilin leader peptidase/N-methyltransferase n=1 Tax=Neisseria weaveri TaxID=28091 RepID=A0A448VLV4_9NEIS|nr:A24 family peptidase [Neisseria weaveri]EGV36793.1 leader peptidase PilD [Neisseria weaveri ATCC 51223]SAY51550.1 protein PilD [Neisseria weaveri]VEJ50704.1 protein PilD [Neisseria weaveri]
MHQLDLPIYWLLGVAAVFGLLVGSFLNVVIYRLPVMMERSWTVFSKEHLELPLSKEEKQRFDLIKPDSRCPTCHTPVRFWQNIPVISYCILKGKCAECATPISKRYPLVELLTSVLFVIVVWQYGVSWFALGGLVLTAFLIALTFIDADTQYLPDSLTLPLIWLGLLFNWDNGLISLQSAVLGAVLGYSALWLLCYVYRLLTGKIGMGGGDLKLLAALGAWLGVGALPVIVFLSALVGIVVGLLMKVAKNEHFAFGPSLAIVGWLVFVANTHVSQAIDWWLNASGF